MYPFITGIPCDPQLSAPDNGGMECTGDQITGESCTFSCRYGFELMGTETRSCQTNSLWTGVNAVCSHLHCPELKDPRNGYVATPGCTTYFESECEVKCVDGYYVNGPSPHTETCSVNENNELFWWPKYTCQCELISTRVHLNPQQNVIIKVIDNLPLQMYQYKVHESLE